MYEALAALGEFAAYVETRECRHALHHELVPKDLVDRLAARKPGEEWPRIALEYGSVLLAIEDRSMSMFGVEFDQATWCEFGADIGSAGTGGFRSVEIQ